ncbi:hypothetical protein DAPPUDRAFT_335509 [Daphnia pulex]|uniref:Uncharacterized protein n=1 Tax=Daphnia pulex TaxID=6669 RepID=E9HXX7_DAPPU|nr:hypothetical protein DAPPUDRAFT_335509 [Daphnia pulex]|eukprot:EFX63404.1 hypothetical protein DAPPUDRAFT_335509 [Daphnia pulex]
MALCFGSLLGSTMLELVDGHNSGLREYEFFHCGLIYKKSICLGNRNMPVTMMQNLKSSDFLGADAMSHISAIETLAEQLKNIGEVPTLNQICTKIIYLPSNLCGFITTCESFPKEEQNIPLLTTKILNEESKNAMFQPQDLGFRANSHDNRGGYGNRGDYGNKGGSWKWSS